MTTTNMGWSLPVTGASSDTWGDLLNAIFTNQDSHAAGLIYGLTLSAAGSTATFGIAAGAASGMVLSSAYTKTTGSWAVGSTQGALDTGTIANNTWYSAFIIQRSDTGVVDILVSTSATAPTMPANYDRKRRIGSMKTDGSAQWVAFTQLGDEFLWKTPVEDKNAVASGVTTAQSITLTVPTGIQVNALFTVINEASAGTSSQLYISSLDQTDVAASVGSAFSSFALLGPTFETTNHSIRTNTSAQVRFRFSLTDATYYVNTRGWIDRRGRD